MKKEIIISIIKKVIVVSIGITLATLLLWNVITNGIKDF